MARWITLVRFTVAHVSVALMLAGGPATAASSRFPAIYRGVWTTVGQKTNVAADAPSCKASDFDEHSNDGLVSVKASSASYMESDCDLVSVAQTSVDTIDLAMSCHGEGTDYKSKETWAIRKIDNQDLLVMAIPSRSMITLYVRCH